MSIYGKLFELKKKLEAVKKDSSGYNYKYADLNACHEVLDPHLESLGLLWITQPTSESDGGVGVDYFLIDVESGDRIQGSLILPLKAADPQGAGSAITYARRYALAAVGLFTEEDDDGERASGNRGTKKPTKRRTSNAQEAKAFIPDGEKSSLINKCQNLAEKAHPKNEALQQEEMKRVGAALVAHMDCSSVGMIRKGEYDKAWEFLESYKASKPTS